MLDHTTARRDLGLDTDRRLSECEECRGRGGEYRYPCDDPTNKLMHGDHWYSCRECNGTGTKPPADPDRTDEYPALTPEQIAAVEAAGEVVPVDPAVVRRVLDRALAGDRADSPLTPEQVAEWTAEPPLTGPGVWTPMPAEDIQADAVEPAPPLPAPADRDTYVGFTRIPARDPKQVACLSCRGDGWDHYDDAPCRECFRGPPAPARPAWPALVAGGLVIAGAVVSLAAVFGIAGWILGR